eukprot:357281-Chlamydomonas_euryale.AAC.29
MSEGSFSRRMCAEVARAWGLQQHGWMQIAFGGVGMSHLARHGWGITMILSRHCSGASRTEESMWAGMSNIFQSCDTDYIAEATVPGAVTMSSAARRSTCEGNEAQAYGLVTFTQKK